MNRNKNFIRQEEIKGSCFASHHLSGNTVVSKVTGWNFAVAGSKEARHGRGAVEGEGLFENWFRRLKGVGKERRVVCCWDELTIEGFGHCGGRSLVLRAGGLVEDCDEEDGDADYCE